MAANCGDTRTFRCSRAIAGRSAYEITPPTTKPTVATTQPTEARFQVRRITASGEIVVTMRGGELRCDHILYDPITHLLTAYGTEKLDAVFSRTTAGPSQPIRAMEMQWDAKSDLPKITRMNAQFRK